MSSPTSSTYLAKHQLRVMQLNDVDICWYNEYTLDEKFCKMQREQREHSILMNEVIYIYNLHDAYGVGDHYTSTLTQRAQRWHSHTKYNLIDHGQ